MQTPGVKSGAGKIFMNHKIFIDTNILVYSIDKFDKRKQNKARLIIKKIAGESTIVISTQVLQEFYVASVKKLNANPLVIKEIINGFEKFDIITVNVEMIKDAIDLSLVNKISFWDALIVVAAEISKCSVIFTEDLNHGQTLKGIQIVNPFLQ